MHPQPHIDSVDDPWRLDEAERVALAYHQAAGGDAWAALVAIAGDALTDRDAIERRLRTAQANVSRGYLRGSPLA